MNKDIDARSKETRKESQGYAAKLRNVLNTNTKIYIGKSFINYSTGNEAMFSVKSQKELRSRTENSKENGFTLKEHFEVANKIVELYQNADFIKKHGDIKYNSKNLMIERYLSQEIYLKSGKKVRACITIKHTMFTNKRLIYSIEIMKAENALEKTRQKGLETKK